VGAAGISGAAGSSVLGGCTDIDLSKPGNLF
jgi:hypothetical protein